VSTNKQQLLIEAVEQAQSRIDAHNLRMRAEQDPEAKFALYRERDALLMSLHDAQIAVIQDQHDTIAELEQQRLNSSFIRKPN